MEISTTNVKNLLANEAKNWVELYDIGVLSMSPSPTGGPAYYYTPKAHLVDTIFFELFADDLEKVELITRGEDTSYDFEYQVEYEGVMFFCISNKRLEDIKS